VPIREFFLNYRQVAMTDDEILVSVHIPLPKPSANWFIHAYRQARRRSDDISIVTAGLQVQLENIQSETNQWRIVSCCFSFGGMAPTTIMINTTQNELSGQLWTKATIAKACQTALKELPLNDMTPGGQPEYRYCLFVCKSIDFHCWNSLDMHCFNHFYSNFIFTFERNLINHLSMKLIVQQYILHLDLCLTVNKLYQKDQKLIELLDNH